MSIATMKKSDRCSTEEVYVSGFVPSYLLPNKCPSSLDPFLEILVKELEDLFVNGNGGGCVHQLKRFFFPAWRLNTPDHLKDFPLER